MPTQKWGHINGDAVPFSACTAETPCTCKLIGFYEYRLLRFDCFIPFVPLSLSFPTLLIFCPTDLHYWFRFTLKQFR